MSIIISGGVELNGLMRVNINAPSITPYCQIVLKGVSVPTKGTVILSEIINGEGFGISSTSPADVGQTIYFDVIEVEGAKAKWEVQQAAKEAQPEAVPVSALVIE